MRRERRVGAWLLGGDGRRLVSIIVSVSSGDASYNNATGQPVSRMPATELAKYSCTHRRHVCTGHIDSPNKLQQQMRTPSRSS